MLVLQIVLGLVALALGIWWGLPGRYDQTVADIDRILEEPGRRRRKKVKRHFTPLAWFNRRIQKRDGAQRARARFRLEVPEDD